MIGQLRGKLLTRQPPTVMLDVHGVGYILDAPMSTIYELPQIGSEVTLVTHMVVRDDALRLYGFYTQAEHDLFLELIKVTGIGPKIGLAILSGMAADELTQAVINEDIKALIRVPGIGKKTAQRLIMELRDRLDKPDRTTPAKSTLGTGRAPRGAQAEARFALEQLGYKPAEAARLVTQAAAEDDSAEAVIRKALRLALR